MRLVSQKRKENIAEYILLMWQITDLLRTFRFNEAKIRNVLVDPLALPAGDADEELVWYMDMCKLIKDEGKEEKGFLSITEHILNDLYDFHLRLENEPNDSSYKLLVFNATPALAAFKEKVADKLPDDVFYAFYALYSKLLMQMKNVELSHHTRESFEEITRMIAYLTKRFMQFEQGKFSFSEE